MRKIIFLIFCFCSLVVNAEDFYLPLVGYFRFDKATKKSEEVNAMGVCCLEGADMFVYINKTKIDCRSVGKVALEEYSNETVTLSADAEVMFDCLEPIQMQIVLNFVNKILTNVYLRGSDVDYEFYLGDI